MEFVLMFLGAIGLSMTLGTTTDQNDSEVDEGSPEPEPPLDPLPAVDDDMLDTGASVIENADGSFEIELGEDETGSLAALKFVRTSNFENLDEDHSLGLYLVPEGTDIPIDPSGRAFDGLSTPEDVIEAYGLVELVRWDLGTDFDDSLNPDAPDTRVEPPEISANAPIEIIRIHWGFGDGGIAAASIYGSESDETLSPFEEPGVHFQGTEVTEVTGNWEGGETVDAVYALQNAGGGVLLSGNGGDDYIASAVGNSTVRGGDGEDYLLSTAEGDVLYGDGGDDKISAGLNSTIHGGDGDDELAAGGPGISIGIRNALPIGEISPDVPNHSVAFAGAGDDDLFLRSHATGYGGAGDDTLMAYLDHSSDIQGPITMTGGADSDSFHISTHSIVATIDGARVEAARITDFDPAEDVIHVNGGPGTTVIGSRVEEAPDASFSNLIVELQTGSYSSEMVIRLDGISGMSAEQILAVA